MSTQTSLGEIQTAIYQTLAPGGLLDSQLVAAGITGVFDLADVPQHQPFDYLTLGDALEQPNNTFGCRGYSTTMTLHLWSRQRGTRQADTVLARLNTLLDQQSLLLASQHHVYTLYDQNLQQMQPDGLTLHLTIRYQLLTQE